jgi:prepilin-type N-terminal cleavage/methylation domain-containing protein
MSIETKYCRPSRKTPRAFTLVELLVVIGIVAVMISILLPALNKARQSAMTLSCMARLREISNATHLYITENKYSLPPIVVGASTTWTFPSWYGGPNIFPTIVASAGGDVHAGTTASSISYLGKYFEKGYDYRHYVCPTFENEVPNSSRLGVMTFGYNRYLGGAPDNWWSLPGTSTTWRLSTPYKITRIQRSSAYAMFLCRNQIGNGLGTGANGLWFRQDSAAESGAYASPKSYHCFYGLLHNQHGLGGTYVGWSGIVLPKVTGFENIAFVDGSVRSIAARIDRYPSKPLEGVYIRPEHPSPTW